MEGLAGALQAKGIVAVPGDAQRDQNFNQSRCMTPSLVSFCLFAYQQEAYIRQAIEGAFSQTYAPLEIILSDDCSRDATYAIIEKMAKDYTGPHRIITNRNETNLGIAEHIKKITLDIAQGDFLVFAAGDDISLPERVAEAVKAWNASPKIRAFFSNAVIINGAGEQLGPAFSQEPRNARCLEDFLHDPRAFIQQIAQSNLWLLGATSCYDKAIFKKYGGFDSRILQEDGVFAFRSLLEGEIAYVHTPLVMYRKHALSISQPDNIVFRKKLTDQKTLLELQHLKDLQISKKNNAGLKSKILLLALIAYGKKFCFNMPGILFLYLKLRKLLLFKTKNA